MGVDGFQDSADRGVGRVTDGHNEAAALNSFFCCCLVVVVFKEPNNNHADPLAFLGFRSLTYSSYSVS